MDRNNDFDSTNDRMKDSMHNTSDRYAQGSSERTTRAADDLASDDRGALGADDPANRNDAVGETTGGLAGALTGAALGSLGGPIGTIIGGIAGAVGGWWSGKEISIAASHYDENDDAFYRAHHETASTDDSYDTRRPAYQLGHLASQNPDYSGRSFDDVEGDLQRGWTSDLAAQHGDWSSNREHARSAFSARRGSSGSGGSGTSGAGSAGGSTGGSSGSTSGSTGGSTTGGMNAAGGGTSGLSSQGSGAGNSMGGSTGGASGGTGSTNMGGSIGGSTGAGDGMGSGGSMNSGGASGAFGSGPSGNPNS